MFLFRLGRSRVKHPALEKQIPSVNTVSTYVNLSSRQRKLYDDYLARSDSQVGPIH